MICGDQSGGGDLPDVAIVDAAPEWMIRRRRDRGRRAGDQMYAVIRVAPEWMIRRHRVRSRGGGVICGDQSRAGGVIRGDQSGGGDMPSMTKYNAVAVTISRYDVIKGYIMRKKTANQSAHIINTLSGK